MRTIQTELHLVPAAERAAVGPGLREPWRDVLRELEGQVQSGSRFRSYLAILHPVRLVDGRLSLAGPPRAVRWSAARYGELVLDAVRRRLPEVREIEFLADRADPTSVSHRVALADTPVRFTGWRSSCIEASDTHTPG